MYIATGLWGIAGHSGTDRVVDGNSDAGPKTALPGAAVETAVVRESEGR